MEEDKLPTFGPVSAPVRPADFVLLGDPVVPSGVSGRRLAEAPRSRRQSPWFLGYVAGFACGGAAVSLLWLATVQSQRPEARNRPSAVLATPSRPDPAASIPLASAKALDAADLAFGEQQVSKMVKDRPEMLKFVTRGDAVWGHCVRSFAGEAVGEHIYWDGTIPEGDTVAEHQGPYHGDRPFVRVRKEYASGFDMGQNVDCNELWASVVYELENIRNTPAFNDIFHRACRGAFTREAWIRENTRLEYLACRRTASFYRTQWKPLMDSRGHPVAGGPWFADTPSTYEEWISEYTNPDEYPWSFWGRYYDTEIAPYARGK